MEAKKVTRDRGASYNDKRSNPPRKKKIAILNVYTPKKPTKTAKYVKQKLIELKEF